MTRRPATGADLDRILAIRRDAFREYVERLWGRGDAHQRAETARELATGTYEVLEQGGSVVGYLHLLRVPEHDYLDELALDAAHRGQGLGTTVLRELQAGAAARGVPLRLSVLTDNPARALYARLGFTELRSTWPRVTLEWRAG